VRDVRLAVWRRVLEVSRAEAGTSEVSRVESDTSEISRVELGG